MGALWQSLAQHVLMLMFIMPLVGACIVLFSRNRDTNAIRQVATTNILMTFLLSIVMLGNFNYEKRDTQNTATTYQMVSAVAWTNPNVITQADAENSSNLPWLPDIRISLGVDEISLIFVGLTALLFIPVVMIAAPKSIQKRPPYYAIILMLEAALIGLFSALDVVFFSICLGLTTFLLYVLIGTWGGYDRRRVINKFFVFNWLGDGLILLGLLSLVHAQTTMNQESPGEPASFAVYQLVDGQALVAGDSNVHGLQKLSRTGQEAWEYWNEFGWWISLCLLIGFAIKIPLVPFHTWFSPALAEAPSAAGLVMSTLYLKIGLYGTLRFLLPLFPDEWPISQTTVLMVASFGCLFTGLLTLAQDDIKKLATYAALNQTIFAAAGIFSLNPIGISGSLLLLINHAAAFGILFYLISAIEIHYKTRDIEAFSGWFKRYPRYSGLALFCMLTIVGCPLLGGFTGQVLTLWGIYFGNAETAHNLFYAACNAMGSIFVLWSFVWYFQRVFQSSFREPTLNTSFFQGTTPASSTTNDQSAMRDCSWKEIGILSPLVLVIVAIGLMPQCFIGHLTPAVEHAITVTDKETRHFETIVSESVTPKTPIPEPIHDASPAD